MTTAGRSSPVAKADRRDQRVFAAGLLAEPDATAESFRADSTESLRCTFLTHDLGRVLPDGNLEHLGRVDRVVKIRGLRVDLGAVEAALHASGLVEEAAAMAPEEATGDRRLRAYVVPRGGEVSPQECRRVLRSSLPEHMVPNEFVSLERLPRTLAGKIDWPALSQKSPAPEKRAGQTPPPRKGLERHLAFLWEDVLRISGIGRNDDFFDLGGTSLQAVELLARIQEKLDVLLPASALVEHSTIEELAVLITDRVIAPSSSPLVVLRQSTTGNPLFVHAGHGNVAGYGQLARRLPERAVYGLQAIGLDGDSAPVQGIPAMARVYLREVLARQPQGPIHLGGARMGALVAFEMAHQLRRQGRSVGLVAMIDFYPPPPKKMFAREVEAVRALRDRVRILGWSAFRARIGSARRDG